MPPAKLKEALQFMRREMANPIWWVSRDLTRAGNPAGNPPDLTASEAESVFHLLVQKDLLVPAVNEHKEKCFLLHHAKEEEWDALIADVDKSWFGRHWLTGLRWIGVFLLWLSSIFISTYVSKNVEDHVEDLNAEVLKLKEQLKKTEPNPESLDDAKPSS